MDKKPVKIRTRFAPSPTGYLHIGGLRTALYAYLFAKKNGGDFLLRIEDTDLERYVDGACEIIFSTLKDSGLVYDEGPDIGGKYGPYTQSERKDIYLKYAKQLVRKGGAYYCFCGKERLESMTDENGTRKYDKHCLKMSKKEIKERLEQGQPYVIRQNIPESGSSSYVDMVFGEISVDCKDLDDNVLLKSDGMPTYNFANVVDDRLMKINYVIRGTEYLSSTPKYNLIYDSLGWERPNYIHLPPVMRDAQHKLSKRSGDPSFNDLINEGFLKDALINYIALLGFSPKENREFFSFEELKEAFCLEGLSKSPAIFDKKKLTWMNGEYIKKLSFEEFHKMAVPYYKSFRGEYNLEKLSAILRTRTEVFSEIPERTAFLDAFNEEFDQGLYIREKQKTDIAVAKSVLPQLLDRFRAITDWSHDGIYNAFVAVAQNLGIKNGPVMWCGRIAITGAEVTPGGAVEMAEVLGKDETIRRLGCSIAVL